MVMAVMEWGRHGMEWGKIPGMSVGETKREDVQGRIQTRSYGRGSALTMGPEKGRFQTNGKTFFPVPQSY